MAFLTIPFFTACEAETEEEASNEKNIAHGTDLLDPKNPNGSVYGVEYIVKGNGYGSELGIEYYNQDGFFDGSNNSVVKYDKRGYPSLVAHPNGTVWFFNYNDEGLDLGGYMYSDDGSYMFLKAEITYDSDNNLIKYSQVVKNSAADPYNENYKYINEFEDKLLRKKIFYYISDDVLKVQAYEVYIYNSDETQIEKIEEYTNSDENAENGTLTRVQFFNYDENKIIRVDYRLDSDGDDDIDLDDDIHCADQYSYYE